MGTVRSMIVGDGARLVIAGIVLGSIAALAATRSLHTLLFGVSSTDPVVFVAAACVLGSIAVLASWIPARAVTKADPMHAVRE